MKHFEYLSVHIDDYAHYDSNWGSPHEGANWSRLDILGKNGWKVVAVHWLNNGGYALLMREHERTAKAGT